MTPDEIYNNLKFIENIKLLKITDRKVFLTKQPQYHPSTKQYKQFKIQEYERCIFGMWGKQKTKYRWIPPMTYLYCNYVKIEMENDKKETVLRLASLDDVEWIIGYAFAACYGFSGFELETEYSCDKALIDEYEMVLAKRHEERYKSLLKPDGSLKKYITIEEYLYEEFTEPKGKPLWYNEAEDLMIFGSRSSGKTFSIIGLICWLLLMDGTKSLSKDWIDQKISANIIAGAAGDLPLQEINRRVDVALSCLLNDEDLGVYKAPGLEPIPLLGRHFLGQTNNYFRYKYIVNGRESGGTGSSYRPVSYAANKKGATTSAASTRVALSVVDECGRMPVSIKSIHGSNSALCRRNTKFGVQLFAGTSSSDLDLVQEAKEMFTNPGSFNMHSFRNYFTADKISDTGLYLPALLVQRSFKDENGNTLLSDVLKYFANRRAKCLTPDALREEQLNYPILMEEMWYSRKGSIFPKEQIKKRYNQLLLIKNQGNQEKFRRFVKLLWQESKVLHEYIDPKKAVVIDSFFESQGKNSDKNKNTKSTDCDIIVYEEPSKNLNDKLYFFTLDTYVADEQDEGESLGCFQVWKSDFNISKGETGNILVCEYTAKPDSRNTFYENIEKIIAWYGNPRRKLMFEANRGYDKVVEFFKKRGKEYLMAFSPNKYSNSWKTKITQTYGYLIGAKENKLETLNQFSEWLKESTILEDGEKLNLERLNSLGLLSELLNYDLEDDMGKKANYDRIMASLGFIIGQREAFNIFKEESINPDENIYNAFVKRLTKTKK